MEWIQENRDALGWILLWAWIALTFFLFSYRGRKSAKIYVIDLLLLGGFLYMFFWN